MLFGPPFFRTTFVVYRPKKVVRRILLCFLEAPLRDTFTDPPHNFFWPVEVQSRLENRGQKKARFRGLTEVDIVRRMGVIYVLV